MRPVFGRPALARAAAPSSGGASQDNQPTFLSRLHVRYDAAHFPEDLVFQETADQQTFQGRYVLRHPWKGASQCAEATRYSAALTARQEKEAQNLAQLTGWSIDEIRRKAQGVKITSGPAPRVEAPWYRRMWAARSWRSVPPARPSSTD